MESEAKSNGDQKLSEVSRELEPADNFAINQAPISSPPGYRRELAVENAGETGVVQQCQTVSDDLNKGKKSEDVVLEEIDSVTRLEQDVHETHDAREEHDERPEKLCYAEKISCPNGQMSAGSEDLSEAVVKIFKPLCADYRSDSDHESVDSESDSTASTDSSTDSSSEVDEGGGGDSSEKVMQKEKRGGRDLALTELPPIEDLKISVGEDECVEVGQISSIIETLVVVESYKGTAALDVDTVLFLDCGKRSLGKVFDILGPITEPVYTVRFNSQDQIKALGIEKGQKVYYAPKTQHTMFVFLSEVLKNKGSDASWKDNIEAPSEFQDFSDDEEENLFKNKQKGGSNGSSLESDHSRKRAFYRMKQSSRILQPTRFRHPGVSGQRNPGLNRHPSANLFTPPPAFSRPHFSTPSQQPPFPYSVPPYPPPMHHPSGFSGPSFPVFGGLPILNHNQWLHRPFFQQRAHSFSPSSTPLLLHPPPPPPPPPLPPPSSPTTQTIDGRSQENAGVRNVRHCEGTG